MDFQLLTVENEDLKKYKVVLQEAFQKGFEEQFGKTDKIILPEKDIEQSLNSKGAVAYKAVVDGKMVGGAVVVIDEKAYHNHLDLLFVKYGTQSKGIGKKYGLKLKNYIQRRKFGKLIHLILKKKYSFLCQCMWILYY